MYLVPLSALPSIQPLETVNQEPGAALKQQEGKSSLINSAMEATAVETAVQLTSRAVSAYKEIMQMQI